VTTLLPWPETSNATSLLLSTTTPTAIRPQHRVAAPMLLGLHLLLCSLPRICVMRDEKDPGTLEMPLPRRRGRPPKNGVAAQSAADHSRAYRQRRRGAVLYGGHKLVDLTDTVLLDRLRMAITEGNAKLAGVYARQIQERYPYEI
jgi:hypothetical protein